MHGQRTYRIQVVIPFSCMPTPLHFRENVSLAPFTTFQVGGPARWFAEARSESEIVEAVRFASERRMRLFILGGGSNLLAADAGFDGLVLHIALRGISEKSGYFTSAAGENWDEFVSRAVERAYGGLECLAGIPGTVGGTPIQNVGAYGQEVSNIIRQVRAFDRASNNFAELTAKECGFSYRRSIFNTAQPGRYIVTAVSFTLVPDAKPLLSYADLRSYFKDGASEPTLAQTAAAVREIRRRKGMLLVEGDADCRSAGSFFRNPLVGSDVIAHISSLAGVEVALIPCYPAPGGKVKLAAAWLLDQAGFHKGYALGPAGISSRHTLALINRGGARAADISALRDQIIKKVNERFGIRLEPEPVLLG